MKTIFFNLSIRQIFAIHLTVLLSTFFTDASCQNYRWQSKLVSQSDNNKEINEKQEYFIWKTIINNNVFYLVGSVHVANQNNYPLPKKYMDCYDRANILIMEVKEDFVTIEKKMLEYAQKDKLPEDKYLRNFLDSLTIEKIIEIIGKDEFLKYDNYEAWLLNMYLSVFKLRLVGYDPELAIDKHFRELAEKDNKQVIGLDSLVHQFKLFEFNLPFESQILIIENIVSIIESLAQKESPLFDAYFKGDIESFKKIFLEFYDFENPQMKYIYSSVFADRNIKWVEKIENISKQGEFTYMVLVGAGHYFGPDNILELLRKKNYIIEKVE